MSILSAWYRAIRGASPPDLVSPAPSRILLPGDVPEASSHPNMDRRRFLGAAMLGGAAFGSTSGEAAAAAPATAPTVLRRRKPQVREYWVQCDSMRGHNIVPSGLDPQTGMTFTPDQSTITAVGFRAYTPGWGQPLAGSQDIGPNSGIPGPVLRGRPGDRIVVHFRNNDRVYRIPHSMHPHGVFYTEKNDGAWLSTAADQADGRVEFGSNYTYSWEVLEASVGTWAYHDHSVPTAILGQDVMEETGSNLGMFGLIAIDSDAVEVADREIFVYFHEFYQAVFPGLSTDFDCINGQAYLGNTPSFRGRVGERIRWRVAAMITEFHVFHLHGHRWQFNGRWEDTHILGPAVSFDFDYIEDNPGHWFYHCHVVDHMNGGMMGEYIVTE